MPDFDQRADELMEKEYMLIDILPEQVPAGSKGQFFGIEEYYLQKSRLDAIRRSFADMLLKLNCWPLVRRSRRFLTGIRARRLN